MNIAEMKKMTKHYDRYFCQTNSVVLHPENGGELHIDALLYAPTQQYPFWKLVTMGASDYAMNGRNSLGNRNEYMLFIDPSVDMNDHATACKYDRLLIATALFPLQNNRFLSYGHSIEFSAADNVDVAGVYLEMPQAIHDAGILRCKLSLLKQAICLQVIPLDRQAMDLLLRIGNEEFAFTYAYPEQGEGHWLCK